MQGLPPDGPSDDRRDGRDEPAAPSAPRPGSPIDRRQFLQLSALGAAGALGGERLARGGRKPKKPPAHARHHKGSSGPAVVNTALPSGVVVPTATWLIAENKKPGTLNWICNHVQPAHALEGFASQASAVHGDDVALFVNTTAAAVQTQVYRMGYYQGYGGRLVLQTDFVPATPQPAPTVSAAGTVSCPWKPTMTLHVTKDWPPGCYLLKLVGSGGEQQFVPLTVRDDASMASYVIQNSVTTWQAYNLWGDYSLYYGRTSSGGSDFASRARIVSFDRPYPQTWASGAADFVGNELPLLMHLESFGLDLTYWTDVDLHARPQLLMNHKCLFSLGHDEYWSQPMRQGAAQASAAGVNLAFLGANACYRQIRMEPSGNGPNRLQVCYKDAAEDPIAAQDPSLTTVNWNQAPLNQPESTLIGAMYQSVGAKAPLVVTDASSWFYNGCNLRDGDSFPNVVLGEYDRYVPSLPGPRNLDVLAHSAIPGQSNWSDITYYTAPSNGGGVFASGSASFVSMLSTTGLIPSIVIPGPFPGITAVVRRAMENVYGRFGLGPATSYGSSGANWSDIYTGSAASAGSATGTNSA
ncbi:MAG TPA: N,N-dimethylformamidase beta subunit family domain-containing protein [Acidimicrobiales bacterium]|nr:N,N-dimethylformamidase beta subunit family domain-containing protein [Acidimicrobiales bacterium]